VAWSLFDWANSPMPTVVITFVFAAYFARGIVGNEVEGTALWSWGLAASSLLVAVSAPVLGAIADAGGRRKPWIFGFSALMAIAAAFTLGVMLRNNELTPLVAAGVPLQRLIVPLAACSVLPGVCARGVPARPPTARVASSDNPSRTVLRAGLMLSPRTQATAVLLWTRHRRGYAAN